MSALPQAAQTLRGVVSKLNADKRYGYIQADGGERYYFRLHSVLGGRVNRKDVVEFEVSINGVEAGQLPVAVKVRHI